jgi:hypothetical protein
VPQPVVVVENRVILSMIAVGPFCDCFGRVSKRRFIAGASRRGSVFPAGAIPPPTRHAFQAIPPQRVFQEVTQPDDGRHVTSSVGLKRQFK